MSPRILAPCPSSPNCVSNPEIEIPQCSLGRLSTWVLTGSPLSSRERRAVTRDLPLLLSNARHGSARGDAPLPRPAMLPPDVVTTPSRQGATPSAQHRWRIVRQQASASASNTSRKTTCPAWRRIRPATCTSFHRTVAIVCDAHAAGQAKRLNPMNKL